MILSVVICLITIIAHFSIRMLTLIIYRISLYILSINYFTYMFKETFPIYLSSSSFLPTLLLHKIINFDVFIWLIFLSLFLFSVFYLRKLSLPEIHEDNLHFLLILPDFVFLVFSLQPNFNILYFVRSKIVLTYNTSLFMFHWKRKYGADKTKIFYGL